HAHVTPKSFGSQPQGLTDHIDFILEGDGPAASVSLSLVAQPRPYTVKVYCDRGSVQIDVDRFTLVVEELNSLPRTVNRLLGSLSQGRQLAMCATENIVDRVRGKLVPFQGLRTLIGTLYQRIRDGGPSPVSPELALAVTRGEQMVLGRAGSL